MQFPEIRTVPAADMEIPTEVSRLYDLAYNLWWTWQPAAQGLFSTIDPVRWAHDHNPVELLINVEPQRWESLLVDDHFLASYHAVVQKFDGYLNDTDERWFRRAYPAYDGGPVAYFCSEYGWHESLGIYSGGLGILAGDHCKAASDLGIPFVGIGLMYRRGYFRQTIDADGHQQHLYADYDVRRLPVLPVTHPNGRRVRVAVELPGRRVRLRIWKATVGRVPVLLLDSDCPDNDPGDRPITAILYVRGREMRLCQEIVLGEGGVLALRALGIEPSVWHMNEGHSAFLSLQRIRDAIARHDMPFEEARAWIRKKAVFTTHTPVPAGNEVFDAQLIRKYLSGQAVECRISGDDLLALGRAREENHDAFNMTALAIRTSRTTNGVSKLHGGVANAMWRHLWPDSAPDPRVGYVTNGVHVPTWMGPEVAAVLRNRIGSRFEQELLESDFEAGVKAIPDAEIWAAHGAQKRRLLLFARRRLMEQFARHGRSPEELRAIQELLDPDIMTVGFARRFATYKRAALVFRDLDRLREILTSGDRPVQLVFAGKAHPADRPGQGLIQRIFQATAAPEFQGRVVFLENYNIQIARHLVQGVDLWLNTPRRPLEASGTSGMKAAINGGLNLSVLDGWWCEGYDPAHGWVVGEAREYDDAEVQDREDAGSLYRVLSEEIVPCYYSRDGDSGLPGPWIERMKCAMGTLTPRFSASRLLRDYTMEYYRPGEDAQDIGVAADRSRAASE
jgi:starch phosphorylase